MTCLKLLYEYVHNEKFTSAGLKVNTFETEIALISTCYIFDVFVNTNCRTSSTK